MKKLINLLFDRIERVLWFRYMIWVLKRNDNSAYYYPIEYDETTKKNVQKGPYDHLPDENIDWLRKHRNDYLEGIVKKTTGIENSTHVTDDKS
jgi:hypothetical protein